MSPLLWDVFAVSTYATVSLLFWYLGMVPDLATLRDRATGQLADSVLRHLEPGLAGSSRHWHVYERAYLLLAALATPLVLSVHSVVSFDFAVVAVSRLARDDLSALFRGRGHFQRLRDGHHAGHSGPRVVRPEGFHHPAAPGQHGEDHAGDRADGGLLLRDGILHGLVQRQRLGPVPVAQPRAGPAGLVRLGDALLQRGRSAVVLVSSFARRKVWLLCAIGILVNVGMWFERFVIIVIGLHRDFLPSSWGNYYPSYVEVLTLVGSFGLFLTLFLLFCRWLPVVAMAEVKAILPKSVLATDETQIEHG